MCGTPTSGEPGRLRPRLLLVVVVVVVVVVVLLLVPQQLARGVGREGCWVDRGYGGEGMRPSLQQHPSLEP